MIRSDLVPDGPAQSPTAASLRARRSRAASLAVPAQTTRSLIEALRRFDLTGCTFLEIGDRAGMVSVELMPAGIVRATLVGLAGERLDRARQQIRRHGYLRRIEIIEGDIAEVEGRLSLVNVVLLDGNIGRLANPDTLLVSAAGKCRCLFGISYPRDRWLTRISCAAYNRIGAGRNNLFQSFVHSEKRMNELLRGQGFERVYEKSTILWRTRLYRRVRRVGEAYCNLGDTG